MIFQEHTSKTGKASGLEEVMARSARTARAPIAALVAVQPGGDKRSERHDALICELSEIQGGSPCATYPIVVDLAVLRDGVLNGDQGNVHLLMEVVFEHVEALLRKQLQDGGRDAAGALVVLSKGRSWTNHGLAPKEGAGAVLISSQHVLEGAVRECQKFQVLKSVPPVCRVIRDRNHGGRSHFVKEWQKNFRARSALGSCRPSANLQTSA